MVGAVDILSKKVIIVNSDHLVDVERATSLVKSLASLGLHSKIFGWELAKMLSNDSLVFGRNTFEHS